MYRPPLESVPEAWDDAGWERFGRGTEPDYEAPVSTPLITQVSTVTVAPVAWLWEYRVPQAALVLLDGHPDTGKSSISLDLAARLSTGRRMPDGSRGDQGATLLLSTEDMLARPVRERLEVAGADLEKVYGLEVKTPGDLPRTLIFPDDARLVYEAIGLTEAKLVVIDPIMGHLSGEVNSNIDQDVRRALNPLARIAAATGATILMVRHLRKPDRKQKGPPTWIDGGGSSGGFGIVRAGLIATKDEDDGHGEYRTLHVGKHNYSEWARPIDYMFESVPGHGVGKIRWLP